MNSGLAALIGALIGGGFSFSGTWFSNRQQWKRELWLRKVETLEKVNENFLDPLLSHSLRLKVTQDVSEIDKILSILRSGRSYSFFLPGQLKEKILALYSALEKNAGSPNVKDTLKRLAFIEAEIHRVYSSVGSILDIK